MNRIRLALAAFSLMSLACASGRAIAAASENPCTNGSFESLDANGFPSHWSWVGKEVSVCGDAHSGRLSLRLLRPETTSPREETGLNRGTLIDRLRGGVDFHYKAVSAGNADLQVYVIAVNAAGIEKTGSGRARYTVPKAHVGDGRWHHARLKYDFTKDPTVKSVHFAARIEGRSGELLLDDFSYVERVGAALRFGTPRIEEPSAATGGRCVLEAKVDNAGDALADNVRATLELPPGLSTDAATLQLGRLAPGGRALAAWTLHGDRNRAGTIALRAECGAIACESRLMLAPQVELVCAGPQTPVVFRGEEAVVLCRLANRGNAAAPAPGVEVRHGTTVDRPALLPIPPGKSLTVRLRFRADTTAASLPIDVIVKTGGKAHTACSTLKVIERPETLHPAGRLDARVAGNTAALENARLRLVFYRAGDDGFGPAQLFVRSPHAGWQSVAWLPQLATLARDGAKGIESSALKMSAKSVHLSPQKAELLFEMQPRIAADARVRVRFSLGPADRSIQVRHELIAGATPLSIRRFDGPMVYVTERDEAVYPGLEWLVDDEVSSGTLDIAAGHADQVRYVVHPQFITAPAIGIATPHGAVGLFWDVHQKWDGRRDRPAAVFASPDRFDNQSSHLMGLFLPSVPEFVDVNQREAARPYRLAAGATLSLESHLLADGEAARTPAAAPNSLAALAALDAWIGRFGIPEPRPVPRQWYAKEIDFAMQAYLTSLWDAPSQSWWTSKGGGVMSSKDRPHAFVADLLLGAVSTGDPTLAAACRHRADDVLKHLRLPPQIDRLRWPSGATAHWASPAAAAESLLSRNAEGLWTFNAHLAGSGPFEGLDYRELGPHNAAELGLCARKMYDALVYARVTGDREAYRQAVPTLEAMTHFRVPRAAQVWEVPVHCPDILAAADALDAFLEAYAISGERRWLDAAKTQARRGLPFVYLWDDPKQPFLLGASIPVMGATWYQGSWFGRPVQWNGLRYAEAILKLADLDKEYPWRQIAVSLVHSALYQYDTAGEHAALWPDNLSAIDGEKCAWMFAPREVLHTMLKLMGRDEDPRTVVLGTLPARLHITSCATIDRAAWDGTMCRFRMQNPKGEQGVALVCNVARPTAVLLDDATIPARSDVEQSDAAGWRYDPAGASLAIRVPTDRPTSVRIEGAAWRYVDRMPRPTDKIDFVFADGLQGWAAANHIDELSAAGRQLQGRIVGRDPYVIRAGLNVPPNRYRTIVVRMKVDAGQGGEFYFGTAAAPGFAADRVVGFPLIADGRFHDYRIDVGSHPAWTGQTITAIRIDPGNGARQGTFAIERVRGERD